MEQKKRKLPPYSKDGSVQVTDEVINTITHMAGAIFSVFGSVLLIALAASQGKVLHVIGFSIYGAGLILLFTASTLHHGLDLSPKANKLFRLFDYLAIYLLIAGTYTPLCLVLQMNVWGMSTLGVVWVMTAMGISMKAVFPDMPKWTSNTFYISIGWVGVLIVLRSLPVIGIGGLLLVLTGGIVYTAGALIYYFEKPNPVPGKFGFHEIWHLFVLTGAVLHYLFMFFVVLPA